MVHAIDEKDQSSWGGRHPPRYWSASFAQLAGIGWKAKKLFIDQQTCGQLVFCWLRCLLDAELEYDKSNSDRSLRGRVLLVLTACPTDAVCFRRRTGCDQVHQLFDDRASIAYS